MPRASIPGPGWNNPLLPDLPTVSSKNGILDTHMTVSGESIEFPGSGLRWNARVYNKSFCGPLIRLKRSDRLKIRVVNKLGPNPKEPEVWLRKEGQAAIN